MRNKNVFWGIVLLAAAAALLLGRLGYLEGVGFWPIIFNIGLLAILLKGIARRNFDQIIFPLAALIIVNDELLGLEAITPWPVLGAALLGNMGLKLLFPRFGQGHKHPGGGKGQRKGVLESDRDGDYVSYENTFGESTKYLSGMVGKVDAENTFGSLQLYFTETLLKNHMAEVNVETSFGNIVIYVPGVWKVVLNVGTAFGNVAEKGKGNPFGEDVLYIGGSVNFGNLEIVYVGEEECAGSESFGEQDSQKPDSI